MNPDFDCNECNDSSYHYISPEQHAGIERVQREHIARMLGVPVEEVDQRFAEMAECFPGTFEGMNSPLTTVVHMFIEPLFLKDLLATKRGER